MMKHIPVSLGEATLLQKIAEGPNKPNTKRQDPTRVKRIAKAELLKYLTSEENPREEFCARLRELLVAFNATGEDSFKVHVDAIHRALRGYTEADRIRVINEIRAAMASVFMEPWDDARKLETFQKVFMAPLEHIRKHYRTLYDESGLRSKGRAKKAAKKAAKGGKLSKTQKQRYIPYDDLVSKFTDLEEEYRSSSDLGKKNSLGFLRYCIIVACLTYLLADRTLRRDIGVAWFGEDSDDVRVLFLPEPVHFFVKEKCKTGREGDEPTIITCNNSPYLRECLGRVHKKRVERGENYLFTKRDGDEFPTLEKHWDWFGSSILDMCERKNVFNIGRVGVTAIRLSIAMHLHSEHDALVAERVANPDRAEELAAAEVECRKDIEVHMDHQWQTQLDSYHKVLNKAKEQDIEVASDDDIEGGSEQGSENGVDNGEGPSDMQE
jgi:hypothetical protein